MAAQPTTTHDMIGQATTLINTYIERRLNDLVSTVTILSQSDTEETLRFTEKKLRNLSVPLCEIFAISVNLNDYH